LYFDSELCFFVSSSFMTAMFEDKWEHDGQYFFDLLSHSCTLRSCNPQILHLPGSFNRNVTH
jgi:hypothetical protein